MNQQEILGKLPERIRDEITITDQGNKITITHPYIEDESLYALTRQAIEKLGGEVGTYFEGVMHYYIPKGVTPLSVSMDKSKPPKLGTDSQVAYKKPENEIPTEIGVKLVNVDDLVMSPFWTREFREDESFNELVESVKKYGVAQNLLVRLVRNQMEIVIGHRRWLAVRKAGLTQVPVKIRELSDEQVLLLQFDENERREDLTDMEKAHSLRRMIDFFDCTQEALAQKLGKSRQWITNHMRMLKLEEGHPGVIVETGTFTERQARELLKAPEEKREEILKQAREQGKIPSARKIAEIVKPKTCEGCHVASSDVKDWNGHDILLCSKCMKDANAHPERYLGAKKTKEVTEKITAKQKPFIETWEFRKERMKVPRSKFEDLFDEEAAKDGLPYGESNVDVCVQKKNVDKKYETPKGTLFVEFLGPVHEGQEDKDEEKRRVLLRQPNTELIEFKYESPSTAKAKEVVKKVRVKLVEMGAIKKEAFENA